MKKVYVVFDTTKKENDKDWLNKITKKYINNSNWDMQSVYTLTCLSRNFNKNILCRIWVRIDVLFTISKLLFLSNSQDVIIFWSPYMASIFNYLEVRGAKRKVISMGWLQPRKSRMNGIEKKLINSENSIIITKNEMNVNQLVKFYNIKNTCKIKVFPDVLNINEGIYEPKIFSNAYIFMGGRSNRDWESFLIYAKKIPNIKFIGCASAKDWKHKWDNIKSDNVEMYFDVELNKYNDLMMNSSFVLTLLKDSDKTSGLINIIRGAQWGKICFTSKIEAVMPYYSEKLSFLLLDNEEEKNIPIIKQIIEASDDEYLRIARIQQEFVLKNFSPESFVNILSEVL